MNYLDAIVADRARDIAEEKRFASLETLQELAAKRSDVRDFASAARSGSPAIIAEIKRASPSAGPISPGCDAAAAAVEYERGGAAAISVLTEPRRFLGSLADLRRARAAVSLPVLCKDFVVDDFQIWKASAMGADAILLIVAALKDKTLMRFLELCDTLGIAALVEVHDADEALRARSAGARIIGINNRQLQTFSVDMQTAVRVRETIPAEYTVVAESGYREAEQVREAAAAGINAVLIGERFMRAADRAGAIRGLREMLTCPE